jgi:hypothetical protein
MEHMKSCPRKSPLSGSEPAYDPAIWNRDIAVRETHNCYSYAMNVNDPKQMAKCKGKKECDAPFHQPGSVSKYPFFKSNKPKTCPNMVSRLLGDNPNLVMTDFEKRCPPKTSKIALVIDQSEDYHFLRQDKNGYWSQKSGARPVTNLDAGKHQIWDPQLADANFSNNEGVLNYDVFCSYMCVPREKSVYMRASGGGITRRRSTSRAATAYVSTRPFRTHSTLKNS